MKNVFRSSLVAALLLLGAASSAQAQSPVGYWKTIDDDGETAKSIVQIYEQEGELYGKVVKILNASEEAERNEEGQIICTACDGDQKNKPVEGLVIIEGLEKDGDEWKGGTIMDPAKGKTYKAKMKLNDDGTLDVRGYVGFSFIGRTQTWQPAEEPSDMQAEAESSDA